MGSYVNSVLVSGEKIEYEGHVSYIFLLPGILLTLVLLPGGLLCMIGVALLAYEIIVLKSNEYAITNQRVILKTGIISRKTFEMRLKKIEGVSINQTIPGRLFNYGEISIHGTGGSSPAFKFISNPMLFKRKVEEEALGAN